MKDDQDFDRDTGADTPRSNASEHSPSRRRFMRNIGLSGLAAGAASTGFGGAAFAAGDKVKELGLDGWVKAVVFSRDLHVLILY